jgi:antitoxin HicB
MKKKNLGSSFEDFLREEGTLEKTTSRATKRVLAWQIAEAMKALSISKAQLARTMHTSRSQLERLLDPENDKVLLETVHRAASAIGKRATLILEDASSV